MRLARAEGRAKGPLENVPAARALCRAAIVLLSSRIEGYVEDLAEVISFRVVDRQVSKQSLSPRLLYYCSKDIIDHIRETKDPDRVAEKIATLFRRDQDVWSDGESFSEELPFERIVSGFSTPRFEEIRKFIARFGYEDYRKDLAGELRADYLPCVNMVDNVVEQRNKIAHGNVGASATAADVRSMLELVQVFCRATDVVVGNWFRGLGCPIR
ncbi:MAG: hypothetical protein F4Y33_04330 [Gemmatimonadales bacterium]|nr:hypothetical protein [Gemmatimonadales bacterium]